MNDKQVYNRVLPLKNETYFVTNLGAQCAVRFAWKDVRRAQLIS